MAPRSIPGLFMGFHMQPGGWWSGDYIVSPLKDWDASKTTGKKARMDRVKEIVIEPGKIRFPLKAAADARESAIQALKPDLSGVDVTTAEQELDASDGADLGVRERPEKAVIVGTISVDPEKDSGVSPDEGPPLDEQPKGKPDVGDAKAPIAEETTSLVAKVADCADRAVVDHASDSPKGHCD